LRTGAVDLRVEEIEMLYSRVCVASLSYSGRHENQTKVTVSWLTMFECKFENLMKLISIS
jgi:hypothetical protein